jgi:hypothetical protein
MSRAEIVKHIESEVCGDATQSAGEAGIVADAAGAVLITLRREGRLNECGAAMSGRG